MAKKTQKTTATNEWLIKHISCEWTCEFDDKKCHSQQKWNKDKCHCKCKMAMKHQVCEDDYAWIPGVCVCECDKDCDMVKT